MILTSFQACQKCSSPLWPWAAMLIGPFPPRYLSSRPSHLSLPCGNLEVLQRPQLLDCWDFVARYLGHMDGSIQHKKNIQKMFQQSLMSHVSKYNKIFCDSAAYAKYHFYFFNGRPPFTLSTIHWASSTLAALYSLKMGPCRNMHLYPWWYPWDWYIFT